MKGEINIEIGKLLSGIKDFFELDQLRNIILMLVAISFISTVEANPCAGLWWGQRVPHPTICHAYYACYLTVPARGNCGARSVFDPSVARCVPGNQETCEIYGQETTTTTTSTPPPPSLEEICQGLFFAARPYGNSERNYVGCIRSQGVLFQCLDDEVFDHDKNECIAK